MEITSTILENFTTATNRSKSQTTFLYDLCDSNFLKLVMLEEKIKNLHLSYCPGDKEEVEKILAMEEIENPWYDVFCKNFDK